MVIRECVARVMHSRASSVQMHVQRRVHDDPAELQASVAIAPLLLHVVMKHSLASCGSTSICSEEYVRYAIEFALRALKRG